MPIYEYRCENGHTFEVMQKMTDDPVSVCSTCEAPVQRVFHPVAVHFKGKGFYNTDYGTRNRQRETAAAAAESSSSKDGAAKDSAAKDSSSSDGSSASGGDSSSSSAGESKGEKSAKGSGKGKEAKPAAGEKA
jgi:putative FmdB family regulatory protein